jgi:anti-sigma factor RsiW
MTCRKARRELLERFRFGEELDARSAPHLEHLQTCLDCREEVGLDRALVAQLRRALQARVEGYDPSPSSWQLVRERALAAEGGPSLWTGWFGRLTTSLRAAGAVAAVALVVMLGTIGNGSEDVAAFQLRATGRGEIQFTDQLPSDPPPYEARRVWYPPTPLPRPVAGRMSVIMTYGKAGENVATTRPVPRPVAGLLK